MALSSVKIIENIEKSYPKTDPVLIGNLTDYDIEEKIGLFNQYIIGVTPRDEFSNGIVNYNFDLAYKLDAMKASINPMRWPFNEEESDQIRLELKDLSEYFDVELDIERLMNDALKTKIHRYYVVVTVVRIPMLLSGR